MKGSWKTSAAGIGAVLASLGALFNAYSKGDMNGVATGLTGLIAGIGLILARDNDKSSEDVGAK